MCRNIFNLKFVSWMISKLSVILCVKLNSNNGKWTSKRQILISQIGGELNDYNFDLGCCKLSNKQNLINPEGIGNSIFY